MPQTSAARSTALGMGISAARGAGLGVSSSAARGAGASVLQVPQTSLSSCAAAEFDDEFDHVTTVALPVKVTKETQTQRLHDDGLLGRPHVYVSLSGECYHTAVECYGLRSVEHPHRLRSCSFCCCALPKFSERRR